MTADIDADALIAFTQQLVRIPSVHDPARGLDEQAGSRARRRSRCARSGGSRRSTSSPPAAPTSIATVDGGGGPGPTLMFEGHTDVVTEGDGWTVDPFGGDVVDGRLWGRGSADMKGGLAAMLFATDALPARGPFPGRVVLAALVDEEGMMLGAKDFVARGRADGVDARDLLRARGRRDLPRRQGGAAVAHRPHRQDGPRGDAVPGAQPEPGRRPGDRRPRRARAIAVQARFGEHPHLGQVWITPTVLRAGEPAQMNVMPAGGVGVGRRAHDARRSTTTSCVAELDRRSSPPARPDSASRRTSP